MSISNRNRDFSSPVEMHQQVFLRGWSDSATNPGIPGTTGLWRAVNLDASGRMLVAIDNISFSGEINTQNDVSITGQTIPLNVTGNLNTGSYSFVSSGITGSQGFIPAGSLSWSAYVESGVASINGITYNTFESIMGGGYDGQKKLGSPIVVGCTGSAAAPCRLILNWEV